MAPGRSRNATGGKRIFLTSCETHEGAWRHQEERLRALWERSSRTHTLADSPEEADLIIIGNLRDENWLRSLRTHPVVNRYPSKCFVVEDRDDPMPLLRGVYTSATRNLWCKSRYRSASYGLYHPDFQNPHIDAYQGDACARPKKYLFSFTGRACHPVRAGIFAAYSDRGDCHVRDTSDFNLFTHQSEGKAEQQRRFVEVLEASKFALCPRGNGAASIRLFEAMRIGVAPIIVSDDWILPNGPDWPSFALSVREADVAEIGRLAEKSESRYAEMGRKAAEAYAQFFAEDVYFDYLIEQMLDIRRRQFVPEVVHWRMRNVKVFWWRLKCAISRRVSG